MQIIGAILGILLYLNVVLNIFALIGSFIFVTSIQGWLYGLLITLSFLALILTSIRIGRVHLINIFPGSIGWRIISIVLIIFLGAHWIFGSEYIDSLKSRKEALLRNEAIKNNVAESRLESFEIKAGTPLYIRNKDNVVFYGKLPTSSLTVRVYPEAVDIEGVIYREVIFPVKRNGNYLPGIWDSESERYLIEVVSLTEEKTKVEAKTKERAEKTPPHAANAGRARPGEELVAVVAKSNNGYANALGKGKTLVSGKKYRQEPAGKTKYLLTDSGSPVFLGEEFITIPPGKIAVAAETSHDMIWIYEVGNTPTS